MKCRGCNQDLTLTFLNLGSSPIANDLLSGLGLDLPEVYYPLHVKTCEECALVQIPSVTSRESLFSPDYVYYSSFSSSWLQHSQDYVKKMVQLLDLSQSDLVIEVASNDGYLLQYFVDCGIEVLGIEPSSGVASAAIEKKVPTIVEFFGLDMAKRLALVKKPKLIVANNVLAHVPDLHDFIGGFSELISNDGLITFEFPHLVSLIQNTQFDTVYHEHYSYLSITSLLPIFEKHQLTVVDIEKLATHGGSLRVFVAKIASGREVSTAVRDVLREEANYDPRLELVWRDLQEKVESIKFNLLAELIKCKQAGVKVAAYGAAAKGNTLLNFCGLDASLISYVVDLNPNKQGKYLPGSRIPVYGVDELYTNTPDALLLLPWNLSDEIKSQLEDLTVRGMRIFRAVPTLEFL